MAGHRSHRISVGAVAVLAAIAAALPVQHAQASEPLVPTAQLVEDVNKTGGEPPLELTDVNGTVYFTAFDSEHGYELWKSNGTPEGTEMVEDILPGPTGSEPRQLTNVGGTLFFAAYQPETGIELWKSDGTALGTDIVADLSAGPLHTSPDWLTAMGGALYFVGNGPVLWRTNGTADGTIALTSAGTGPYITDLTSAGGALYFAGLTAATGYELWTSNGTLGGTHSVADIYDGTTSSFPSGFVAFDGDVFFTATDQGHGSELWRTGGTPESTARVADIYAGIVGSGPAELTVIDATLFFSAQTFVGDRELWKTDGDETGTVRVADIYPGGAASSPAQFAVLWGQLYFFAHDGVTGRSLRTSNGAGVALVKDFGDGDGDGYGFNRLGIVATDTALFFSADDGTHGTELWTSNDTPGGASLTRDVGASSADSFHSEFDSMAALGDRVFFTADDGFHGRELWVTDRSTGVTELFADIHPTEGSNPTELTVSGDTLYFSAKDEAAGVELWAVDGTATEPVPVLIDLNPFGDSYPIELTDVGGTLYFTADDDAYSGELLKADGTDISLVHDINESVGVGSWPYYLTVVGDAVYYVADDGVHGPEVWRSDAATGTNLVKDVRPEATTGSDPYDLTAVGDRLVFSASDGVNGRELWISDADGSAASLVDINPGPGESQVGGFVDLAGTVLFYADDGSDRGQELWRVEVDGNGLELVKDINDGTGSSYPEYLTTSGSKVFFRADDGTSGQELWTSDGTTLGTASVGDLDLDPRSITAVHGGVVFAGSSDGNVLLWGSTGAAAATVPLGVGPSFGDGPKLITPVSPDTVFFSWNDGVTGREPWSVHLDFDGDGIANPVDEQPSEVSTRFSDVPFGGETVGEITVPTGLRARLSDHSDPAKGLLLVVSETGANGGAKVKVQLDGHGTFSRYLPGTHVVTDPGPVTTVETLVGGPAEIVLGDESMVVVIEAGESAKLTEDGIGIVTVEAIAGTITMVSGTVLTVVMDAGESAKLTENDDGTVTVEAIAGTVTVNGTPLDQDETVVVATSTLTATRLKIGGSRKDPVQGLDGTNFDLSTQLNPATATDALNEVFEIEIGTYDETLPAHSFKRDKRGKFTFSGLVDGVYLKVDITPVAGRGLAIKATGRGANLVDTENPVTVRVAIGNDSASASVNATFS